MHQVYQHPVSLVSIKGQKLGQPDRVHFNHKQLADPFTMGLSQVPFELFRKALMGW
jgi:hypothetical protein